MEKDFYAKSIEFYLSTKKLSTSEINSLNHPFLKEIPKYLYKYRKSGDEGRIDFYVGERKIYFPSFNSLNDIFEGITPATKERLQKFNGEDMCKYYKDTIIKILTNRFPSLDVNFANQIYEIIVEEHFDNDCIYQRVLNFVEKNDRKKLKTVISGLVYIFDKLDAESSENSDFRKGMRLLMNVNDLMGAYCMCDSYSHENLWALYADDFKGYCIEYDFTNPIKSKGSIRLLSSLYPVTYVDKKDDDWFKSLFESTVASIDVNGNPHQSNGSYIFDYWMIKTVCSKKKGRWSTENEWRVIGDANHSILGPLVSKIIVGHKICKKDFDNICRCANKNWFPIAITDIDYENKCVLVREITQQDIENINKSV